jgi:Outer membrane protein beta-barrel domain
VLAVVTVAAATQPSAQQMQFGAKAGPSFTGISLAEPDGQDYHPRIAAAGGGFIALPLAPRLAIQFEAMSMPKGTRVEEPGSNLAQTLMLRYVELPALLRVSGPRLWPGFWSFSGGPYLGIRVSAKEQISTSTETSIAGAREDVSDFVERFEGGLAFGAAVDIGKYLMVEGRYSHGLTNVNAVEGLTRFTNHGVSIMAGVRF